MALMIKGLSDSPQAIERVWLYRHILQQMNQEEKTHVSSEELAERANLDVALVRRDLMMLKSVSSLARGYEVSAVLETTAQLLGLGIKVHAAVIGVGNLGRAIMSFFCGTDPNLKIVAAFDTQAYLEGKHIHGCVCHHSRDMLKVVKTENIKVGIITAPDNVVQQIVDTLVQGGVKGILNFSHVKPVVPKDVFVEDLSFGAKLEVVTYYARVNSGLVDA